ncbi:hypothetical protein COV15_01715 [Candidatus Woesearchaeota archaeon CG10_big_fil_rev_8_21_14_0_10_34_12]|nr:MAG: hypothetical protein COV15_01715 [Candidatus Woesearchaeota archaeon CG10_big_fil_rev_8_21_14_0_10_34_12]
MGVKKMVEKDILKVEKFLSCEEKDKRGELGEVVSGRKARKAGRLVTWATAAAVALAGFLPFKAAVDKGYASPKNTTVSAGEIAIKLPSYLNLFPKIRAPIKENEKSEDVRNFEGEWLKKHGFYDRGKKDSETEEVLRKTREALETYRSGIKKPYFEFKEGKLNKEYKVVLDPGHGFGNRNSKKYDPGAVYGNREEAAIVLEQAKMVKKLLEKTGVKVIMTREDGKTAAGLYSRKKLADSKKPDVFVSLHCNAATNPLVAGVESCIHSNDKDKKLAEYIQNNLVRDLTGPNFDRGIKLRSELVVLKSKAPSVLIESGFVSNAGEGEYLAGNTDLYAREIADGVIQYLKTEPQNAYGQVKKEKVSGKYAVKAKKEVKSKLGKTATKIHKPLKLSNLFNGKKA